MTTASASASHLLSGFTLLLRPINPWTLAVLLVLPAILGGTLSAPKAAHASTISQGTSLVPTPLITPNEPTPAGEDATSGSLTPDPTPYGITSDLPDINQETLEAEVLAVEVPHPCPQSQDPLAAPGAPTDQCQRVELLFTSGSLKGKKQIVNEGKIPLISKSTTAYVRGDRVLVDYEYGGNQPRAFYITDFIRTNQIYVLALIFVGVAIVFAGLRGFTSMIGLVISFIVLIFFMLPRILAGDDPVVISIITAFGIMLVTLYLSHGFNLKTTAALCGTAISLVITGLLAWIAVGFVKLSGFGSDEATFVQLSRGNTVNLQGLLLGGIIIGALGVLNDITIGQASSVFEMHNIDPSMHWQKLFGHATNIGRDHIAATVNTLVLAYAGASLPLLILFVGSDTPWDRVINQEIVAEEVVRTLVGSIGLIASVPITTLIASLIAVRTRAVPIDPENPEPHSHAHHH